MTQDSPQVAAPYLPLKTFLGALDSFREGVPKRIDRGIWRNQSGSAQGQIMIAFRFFGLLNESDEPSLPLLEKLAKADEPERKKLLKALVEKHYSPIISHDLTKMTPSILSEEMGKMGISGGTVRKSVTFFLQIAKYLDLAMSPFLTDQTRNSPSKRRRSSKSLNNGNGAGAASITPLPIQHSGSTASVDLRGGGTVTMSVTADVWKMPADDRKFVLELVDKIQGYQIPAAAKPKEKTAGQS